MRDSSKDKLGIEFQAVPAQKRTELVFKGHLSMMRFLIPDVPNDGGVQGGAYTESSVTLLPRKTVGRLAQPTRGVCFDGENGFGQRHRWWELNKAVKMIVRAANGMDKDAFIFADTGDVGPEPGLRRGADDLGAILCAEDQVDGVLHVAMGHVPRLRRSRLFILYVTQRLRAGLTCIAPEALGGRVR